MSGCHMVLLGLYLTYCPSLAHVFTQKVFGDGKGPSAMWLCLIGILMVPLGAGAVIDGAIGKWEDRDRKRKST